MKNNIRKFGLLVLIWLVYTFPALAGPVDPPGGDDPLPPDPTPINQWELMLIFAALAMAGYFIMRHKRKAMV